MIERTMDLFNRAKGWKGNYIFRARKVFTHKHFVFLWPRSV